MKKKSRLAVMQEKRKKDKTFALLYHRLEEEYRLLDELFLCDEQDDDYNDYHDVPQIVKRKGKSRKRKGIVYYRDDNGDLQVMPPTMSLWYNHYCQGEETCISLMSSFHDKFRKRFRLPYHSFQELVAMCIDESVSRDSKHFKRWRPGATAADGTPAAPMSLLVLCALRYLGRGWTFDDLEESTAISQDVIRAFFHKFIDFGSEELYKKWVVPPKTLEEAYSLSYEYELAGFPGCIGSMDGTHVEHCRISWKHRQAHLSWKLPFTARTYNLVVNHRRRILGTTDGHPARWNDKSLVKFDTIAMDLHEGKGFLRDLQFELYDYSKESPDEVIKVKYKGAWLLCDNGYLNWGVTIPPMKNTDTRAQYRFSKWLESMRKDVECTFGIMKGRWRILKTGIRLHGTNKADRTWKTCCALHNMLLEVDGLDDQWTSEWEGGLGDMHTSDLPGSVQTLLASNKHFSAQDVLNYDGSGMGSGGDGGASSLSDEDSSSADENGDHDNEEDHATPAGGVAAGADDVGFISVRKLSMKDFRARLIRHFDIAFTKKEICWPKARMKNTMEPTI